MEKIPASVPILTKNSATHLRECLESVRAFSDVYIVDGESTDGTVEIAREYQVPVYKQEEAVITNFSKARTHAQSFAKEDWILYLDSDEFLSSELVEEIRGLFERGIDRSAVFAIENFLIIGERKVRHSFVRQWYPRLFNKTTGVSWKANKVVHEKLFIPDDMSVVNLHAPFWGYYLEYKESLKKDKGYLDRMRDKLSRRTSPRFVVFVSVIKNLARALLILGRSIKMYLVHGCRESLPMIEVWRYIRYHLMITWFRIIQFFKPLS